MSQFKVRADVRNFLSFGGGKSFKVDDFEFVGNGRFIKFEKDEENFWVKSEKVLGIEEVER